ncbi:hypothetical protein M758_10G003200 [Ceratodon purpureus]|nr:hypothetical protein M758_10G003200 [Ceratodon purpureus]
MSKLRKWMMKEERDATSSGSGDLSSSAIKLFGKTIAVSGGADSVSVSVASKAASEEGDGASTQLEGDGLAISLGSVQNDSGGRVDSRLNAGVSENLATVEVEGHTAAPVELHSAGEEVNTLSSSSSQPEKQRALTQEEKKEQCLKKPDKLIPCPRCESVDTKFCYYNNYNINQPRHFCKSCQRYWTAGGTLRNVLVGAGRRKNKYGVTQPKQDAENLIATSVRMDHHEPAQQSILGASIMNAYGTVPPMNLPTHGSSPRCVSESQGGSTITSAGASQGFPVFSSMSAFKPTGAETSSDSVTKLRQRTRTESTSDVKADCASSMSSPTGEGNSNTYVLTPRVTPQQSEAQAVWTKNNAAPLGFFNGAWPYGFNIGWSGAGPHPGAASMAAATPPVWTGMWTSGMAQGGISPVPTFGWNMLQGGWTLPWRPVPAVGVQMQTPSRKRENSGSVTEEGRVKMPRVGSGEEVVA